MSLATSSSRSSSRGTAIARGSTSTIRDFHARHAGGTIIVCGCGTSLNELTDPQRFITIGVNDVGRRFDPTYLVVVNPPRQFAADRFSLRRDLARRGPVHPARTGGGAAGRGTDPAGRYAVPTGPDAQRRCPALHAELALRGPVPGGLHGARRIGLIGVDFTDDHFFARSGRHPLAGRLPQIDANTGRWPRHAAAVASKSSTWARAAGWSACRTPPRAGLPMTPSSRLRRSRLRLPRPAASSS